MKKSLPRFSSPAFTLVELIVVVAVLAVLAMIAFTTVWNVTSSARNSARLTDVSTIVNKLDLQMSFGKVLPKPENGVDLIASGSVVGFQGEFGTNSSRTIELSEIKDPLDNSHYTYTTDSKLGSYQILAFNEVTTSCIPVNTTFAATSKQPFTKGDMLGILYDTTTNVPIEKTWPNTSVDIVNTFSGLTAQFSDSKMLSGTGFAFGGSMWSLLAKQSNFEAPKTCPTGYIPVPGNAEFLQPGFCVMKYEAKVAGGAANSSYNGHNYNASETAISNATDVPVVNIKQGEAITACNKLGNGYHLITNNEWMTIARQIELNGANWNTSTVGNWYIYSGHNNNSPTSALVASNDDTQGYLGTYDNSGSGTNQKRTLTLSNGQVIWDLAGNVWENVNKANTLDGAWYATNQTSIAGCSNPSVWSEWGTCSDRILSASNWIYDSNQWIGQVYYSQGITDDVFLRGGAWTYSVGAGVFALNLSGHILSSNNNVGFRCAKY